jgi:hypothetical protein
MVADSSEVAPMMKHLCVTAMAVLLTLAVAAPISPAEAQDGAKVVTVKKKQKHKRHTSRHVARYRSAYPELEPYRSNGFIGEFPGSCAYDRAAGRCMIDLGYGRCVQCDIGGGGRF